jgi:hypothetical protein
LCPGFPHLPQFLFCGSGNFAVLPAWGGRAVVMSSWEGAMAVRRSGLMGAVSSSRSVVKASGGGSGESKSEETSTASSISADFALGFYTSFVFDLTAFLGLEAVGVTARHKQRQTPKEWPYELNKLS